MFVWKFVKVIISWINSNNVTVDRLPVALEDEVSNGELDLLVKPSYAIIKQGVFVNY